MGILDAPGLTVPKAKALIDAEFATHEADIDASVATAKNAAGAANQSAQQAAQNALDAKTVVTTVPAQVAAGIQEGISNLSATPDREYPFIATDGQTEWTPADGATWMPGAAKVFANGVKWNRTESFDDATGAKITFVRPLVAGYSITVNLPMSITFPITDVSSEDLAKAATGKGADMVGLVGANGVPTTVSALASPAAGKGTNLIAHGTQTLADVVSSFALSRVVNSVAALRALAVTAVALTSVFVTGFAQAGDGGGGPYYRVTGDTSALSDNGGALIKDAAGNFWQYGPQTIDVAVFGVLPTNADNCSQYQAFVNYVVPRGIKGTMYTPGTYKFTSQSITKAASFQSLELEGAGYSSVIVDYSAFPADAPFMEITGGSGTFAGSTISGIYLKGNANTSGFEIDGQCGIFFRKCRFGTNKRGLFPHNKSQGSFTEFVIAEDCLFDADCASDIIYRRTGGNDSFHGTGLRNCASNQSTTATVPKVIIGDSSTIAGVAGSLDVLVYNAELSYKSVWLQSNTPIVQNNSTRNSCNFYGVSTVEDQRADKSTVMAFGQSAPSHLWLMDDVAGLGRSVRLGDNVFRVDSFESNTDGTPIVFLRPYRTPEVPLANGDNYLATLYVTGNEKYELNVDLHDDTVAPAWKSYKLEVAFGVGNRPPNIAIKSKSADYYGGNMPVPVFSIDGANRVVATANFADNSTGMHATVTVRQLAASYLSSL